jgi:flavin-binding protein dodecin
MEAARETRILITSTSPVSFEDAIREGVSRAVSAL